MLECVDVLGYFFDLARQFGRGVEFVVNLDDFASAYNFGRRLKTLKGLTPYEFICKQWTIEPERFNLDPIYQMPGLNT